MSHHSEGVLDPARAIEVLVELAADLRIVSKATVYYRLLLGRHLVLMQKNDLWRKIRRNYRNDVSCTATSVSAGADTYSSWYNFLEQGFEKITGLHRQTAYSAIKLAASPTFSKLSRTEVQSFSRLANALELVSVERLGVEITPELVVRAQEMPIKRFRQVASIGKQKAGTETADALTQVIKVLKSAAKLDAKAIEGLWEIIQHSMTTVDQNPVQAIENIATAYYASICKPLRSSHMTAYDTIDPRPADVATAVKAS